MRLVPMVRQGLLALLLAASVLIGGWGCGETAPSQVDGIDTGFYRSPDFPEGYTNPLDHIPYPQHPYLAPNGRNNMHCDAYMSGTYESSGPLGIDPVVTQRSYASGVNMCVTITFDSQGRIITFNARQTGSYILMLDPVTLEELASYALPPRRLDDPMPQIEDTSGAAYFVLDHEDRVIFADADNALQIIRYSDETGRFELVHKYDLRGHLVPRSRAPLGDRVQMGLHDWGGRLWFMTRFGIVGNIDPDTGQVFTIEIPGEEIQNSFAVAEDGVYFVSDYAMYRFSADESGQPVIDWRTPYDRGTRVKPSMINQGSGTSPLIFGDMVAIGDNADPRMNILFLRRSDGKQIAKFPVFEDGKSTTENALAGLVREGPNGLEYSVIVENNYGLLRQNFSRPGGIAVDSVGGMVRLDLLPDGSGGYAVHEVWSSPVNSPSTVPKISLTSGLLFLHTYDRFHGYFFTALDFETGEMVYRVPTGFGILQADLGAPITLSPEDGVAYMGILGGLLRIADMVD